MWLCLMCENHHISASCVLPAMGVLLFGSLACGLITRGDSGSLIDIWKTPSRCLSRLTQWFCHYWKTFGCAFDVIKYQLSERIKWGKNRKLNTGRQTTPAWPPVVPQVSSNRNSMWGPAYGSTQTPGSYNQTAALLVFLSYFSFP